MCAFERSEKGMEFFMNNKKAVKIAGIILMIIIAIFLIHTIRNYVIISKLQKQLVKYQTYQSYFIKTKTTDNKGGEVILSYYKNKDKEVAIMERKLNGEVTKMSMYNNGQRIDVFYDTPTDKTVQIDSKASMIINSYNFLETDNNWQTFLGSIFARIKNSEYNGKKCYIINDFKTPMFMNGTEKNEYYIEKDTGLYLKAIVDEQTSEREYDFNNVDDSIFIEPDISQYRLQENN